MQVILEDRTGGIWFTGTRGFERLSKKDLNAAAERRPVTLRSLAFGLVDGLRSASFASGQQPAGSIGPDGRIWLPSYRGVVVVDPQRLPAPPRSPGVRLEEALVDGASKGAGGSVEVGPGRRTVELRYSPATLQPSEQVRFRFRLEGYDDAWHEAGTRRSAFYTGIPPGRYLFRAACRIGAGSWGPEAGLVTVVVRPTLYQTWWFRLIALALCVAAVAVAFRLRTRRVRRRQAELERIVEERTEELRRANERLSELSFSDVLTGIANRRRFDETLAAEWLRAIEKGHPISLVLADLDGFRSYGEAFGHAAADRCLLEVARVIDQSARRAGDLAARFVGSEFAVLLPATQRAEATVVAETARAGIEALRIPSSGGRTAPFLTASFGVATIVPEKGIDSVRLALEADASLSRARAAGGNRVHPPATTAEQGPSGEGRHPSGAPPR